MSALPHRSPYIAGLLFLLLSIVPTVPAGQLPFIIKITNVTPTTLPDYLDPYRHPAPNGQWSDFPISTVVIDGEIWIIYKSSLRQISNPLQGSHIEDAVRQADERLNPSNPAYGTVVHPYMLGGMWYDPVEKKLYAPMHCEYPPVSQGPGIVCRQIHLAISSDKGLTWNYQGPLLTNDTAVSPLDYSGLYWDGGDGDFYLFVNEQDGYFYIFTTYYLWPKPGVDAPYFMRHRVARCKIGDKMAPGKWRRFYNGGWTEPGIDGKSSYIDAHRVIYSNISRST